MVEEKELAARWLVIESDPSKANVFIDGKLAGRTPFHRKYEEGEYTYRIEKSRYHNKAGKITLKGEKKSLQIELKPNFGDIQVTSVPEEGMMIFLDGENTGKETPATLNEISSGEHTLQLQSRWYQPQTKKVTVKEEQTTAADFKMEPAFANITVQTQPEMRMSFQPQSRRKFMWMETKRASPL